MSNTPTPLVPPPHGDEDGCQERYEAGYRVGWQAGLSSAARELRRAERTRVEARHAVIKATDLARWADSQDMREELLGLARDLEGVEE